MTGFHQVLIGGYPSGGLMTDRKPFMLPDQAFSELENAYVYRERTRKRLGTKGVGQLSRSFTAVSLGVTGASPYTFNIYSSVSPAIVEPFAQIKSGSVLITVTGISPFTDQENGTLTSTTPGNSGVINYVTGSVTLTTTAIAGTAITISFVYYPSLPSMGICKQDISTFGIDNTIFFDTKYAYQFTGGSFQELAPGTVWSGSITDFFWSANYQGTTPDLRFFFVTNDNIKPAASTYDPIRYYNPASSSWTALTPAITSTTFLFQALIIIPYYGRLLALNTWEGTAVGPGTASNFFSRCRFSKLGNPVDTDSWRSDIFGKGGFLDAPTNEAIVSAAFYRNTLIVFFEYSTWQLRYVGEYGLPFIFERISSDFGAISTFSPIVFDQGVMAVSDRGIIQAGAGGIKRLDDQIPDKVFSFDIQNNGPDYVHGIRDFQKEVVYWNYIDTSDSEQFQLVPNKVLLFNYRNNTWALLRDSITCFGTSQFEFGITWDSLTTFWEDNVSWDNEDDENYEEYITCGNQIGYISIYENQEAATNVSSNTMYSPSLSLYAVDFTKTPTQFTIPNHNLANDEIIYFTNALWTGGDPGINNIIYNATVVDANTITLGLWDSIDKNYVSQTFAAGPTYIGGGQVTLFPKMNIVGKDFNPFQQQGKQLKLSYIDFQMDTNSAFPSLPATTIQLFINSYLGEQANILVGNKELINSSQKVGVISGVSLANPCVVESINHSLPTGTIVYIANILGTTQLNGANYTITVIDANNFSLNGIDSTGFTAYKSGGIWNSSPTDGQSYIPGSQYAWYRFYSTQFGQYLRIALTYDDDLMNQLSTHQTPMELNAMNCWMREGGRLVN